MAKKPSSDYDPFKAENPMLALSAIGLHTATYLTDIWLGAMRGMVDSAKDLERRADENSAPVTSREHAATGETQATQVKQAAQATTQATTQAPTQAPTQTIEPSQSAVAPEPVKPAVVAKAPVQDSPTTKPVAKKTPAKATTAKKTASTTKATSTTKAASKPRTASKAKTETAAKAAAAAKPASPAAKPESPVKDADQVDDLKLISGVGPKLEQFLHRRGITSFQQVAALKKTDIRKLNEELSLSGRIERDDWVGQAKKLSEQ